MTRRKRYPCSLVISVAIAWLLSLVAVLQFQMVRVDELKQKDIVSHSVPSPNTRTGSKSESRRDRPSPFNPFTDLKISDQDATTTNPPYSSYHCVQADHTGYPDYTTRTCEYRNLYYRPSDQSFHYNARPSEIRHTSAKALEDAMVVADGYLRWDKLNSLQTYSTRGEKFTYDWSPKVSTKLTIPSYSTISSPSSPVFVLYLPSYSFNLGHLVFDDMLSIFSMLHMFGYALESSSSQPIPLFVERPNEALGVNFGSRDPFWRCHPSHDRWSKCISMWKRVYPSLLGVTPDPTSGDILRTGNWLRGGAAIGEYDMAKSAKLKINMPGDSNSLQNNSDYILLPRVINGPGRLANWSCKGECTIGRGLWLWEFRRYLLNNILGPTQQEPENKNLITISLPVGSSRSDKVTHFEDVIEAAKSRFGSDRVKAVDMATLSMVDQAQLVRQSAVYLSNHGGGSASAIFLPRGATLLMYHGVGSQGEPKMLDRHFWKSMGYIDSVWIHPNDHHNVRKSMDLIQFALDTFDP